MKTINVMAALGLSLLVSTPLVAAVSPEQADRLKDNLTPLGAERSGNTEGTIPSWDGGLTEPPANYKAGGHMVHPFPDDKVIATISIDNLDEYRDKLTAGQQAMFEKYPESYRMNLYQSRRTSALPQEMHEKIYQNALNARLDDGGNGVTGFQEVIPFPIPQNGLEAIWNHLIRYRGGSLSRDIVQAVVKESGNYTLIHFADEAIYPSNMKGHDPEADSNILVYFKQTTTAPARLTGNRTLVHDTINQVIEPRRAWMYNAGQRRVRRAPQVAYDGPGTSSDGLRTVDNFDLFSGAPDKYNWELKGKREIYIPYNNYVLASDTLSYSDIVQPGHMNPEVLRYELHRVWEVEATLKADERNVYGRRTFYIDEDSWQIAAADYYDTRGDLWRVAEGFHVQYYYADTPYYAAEAIYDLLASRYLALGLFNESDSPIKFGFTANKMDYTPAALRRSGFR
ncbi:MULTISPECIES: DUF1329 domain-containing protein [Marinobacter]|uniref:DUF1329 domain-containing protein n=1 Tax=Marinobacter TaxID=2742 RepID=UPI003B436CD6|nr:DUF1329 domain-containing protein [Marinobacter alkaliphilus]